MNYAVPSTASNNYGQVGYTQNTICAAARTNADLSLTNPFPTASRRRRQLARCPDRSGQQHLLRRSEQRTAPRVQQFSVDFQRELAGSMAITVTYMGARGGPLRLGGSDDIAININQLDPKYLALGAALNEQCRIRSSATPTSASVALHADDAVRARCCCRTRSTVRNQRPSGDRG